MRTGLGLDAYPPGLLLGEDPAREVAAHRIEGRRAHRLGIEGEDGGTQPRMARLERREGLQIELDIAVDMLDQALAPGDVGQVDMEDMRPARGLHGELVRHGLMHGNPSPAGPAAPWRITVLVTP